MKINLKRQLCILLLMVVPLIDSTHAVEVPSVFFNNVRVFDGFNAELVESVDVLVEGNKITAIGDALNAPQSALIINGQGKTLMPGLIDAHWHSMFSTLSLQKLLYSDIGYLNINAAKANESALMRGFTSVRDVGGNVFALKQATDEGLVAGPRIYPSGPSISQTSGHGDLRPVNAVPSDPHAPLDYLQRSAQTLIADGVPEVIKRSREVLRMGASQLKVMAGGGVSSSYDPLDVTQYTFAELQAIVQEASNWNTYVTVHAFTDEAVQQAIRAGVKSIEHGMLLSADTLELMSKENVWLSMQPILNDEDAIPFPDPALRAKYVIATEGTENVYRMTQQYDVKVAWGTDTLFDSALAAKQGKMLAKLNRWFSPYQILRMATYDNAQLLKLSGPRDPYPGELGIIKRGALADLILVDGNPLEEIDLVADPAKYFVVIMKDGKIYKNTLR